jgi:broad specificity phosphatase PhoE
VNLIFIRHAERDPSDRLSQAGKRRAELLRRMFGTTAIRSIFTSEFVRTKQTAAPVAQALGIAPVEISSDIDAAKTQLLAAASPVLVVGHSNTVPELIAALGGPADIQIEEHEFDRMFAVSVVGDVVSVLDFRYVNV